MGTSARRHHHKLSHPGGTAPALPATSVCHAGELEWSIPNIVGYFSAQSPQISEGGPCSSCSIHRSSIQPSHSLWQPSSTTRLPARPEERGLRIVWMDPQHRGPGRGGRGGGGPVWIFVERRGIFQRRISACASPTTSNFFSPLAS